MPEHAVTAPLAFVNHSLALIGEDPLTDLIPESGATNAAAATIYNRVVDTMLSEYPWGFATRDLALSEIVAAPPSPWLAQYNLPANTLRVIATDMAGEDYEIASNHDPLDTDGTRRLYAMRSGVRARVIIRPLDELFPPHFVAALIPQLTAELAPGVTGKLDVADYFRRIARDEISRAKLIDASERPTRRFYERDPRGPSSRLLTGQDFDGF